MDCRQVRDQLSDFQDGTMDEAAAAGLTAHLRGCGECAGADASLLAVREILRGLPPDPAPPELLARVLAAVEAEDRNTRPASIPGGAEEARPFLSRFRVPLEAAAAVLLFASVYWYQQTSTPAPRTPSGLSSVISSEAVKASPSRPTAAKEDTAKGSPPGIRLPRRNRNAAREAAPSTPKVRAWTAENLPSVPAYFASTDSERIVPFAPPRPLQALPYGRDIVVEMNTENREGAEERIAEAALLLGGIVERIERGPAGAAVAGSVRVILPVPAASRFLEEMDRIGTIPPEGKRAASDLPAGARAGTVAYTVRIRVR